MFAWRVKCIAPRVLRHKVGPLCELKKIAAFLVKIIMSNQFLCDTTVLLGHNYGHNIQGVSRLWTVTEL